jgi:hypothetical protein
VDIDGLARDHRVIAYNRRGYPGSGEPISDWVRHREEASSRSTSRSTVPSWFRRWF